MSFYTSLTGLNSASNRLSVSSNNIANSGTNGFKRSSANFGDIFSSSPIQKASSQIGQGVLLKGVRQEFTQGNISTSGNSLDLAITGDGFFPLQTSDGLQKVYSRNGNFLLDDLNYVVNSTGQRLLAATVDSSGTPDLGNLTPLKIPSSTVGYSSKTNDVNLALNLPADARVISAPFNHSDPSTYNESSALTVYDESGNGYLATIYYVKTQANSISDPESKWQTHLIIDDQPLEPRLQQVSNESGQYMEMNGHGDIRYVNNPSSQKVEMYRYDENITRIPSTPATFTSTVSSFIGPRTTFENGAFDLTNSVDNGDGTFSVPGWTINTNQVRLGTDSIGGFVSPESPVYPSENVNDKNGVGVENDEQVVSNWGGSYSSMTDGIRLATGGMTIKDFGVAHGPYIISDSYTEMKAGAQVSFDWSAVSQPGGDEYDVYGYLLKDDGTTIELLDSHGRSGSGAETVTVNSAGNYKFVFVAGTFDASGGTVAGASSDISNVNVTGNEPPAFDDIKAFDNIKINEVGLASGADIRFDLLVDSESGDERTIYLSQSDLGTDGQDVILSGDSLAKKLEVVINNTFSQEVQGKGNHYGIKVDYTNGQLTFSSGTTGDQSSLAVSNVNYGASLLGLDENIHNVAGVGATDNAVRGKASNAAILESDPIILKSDGTLVIDDDIDLEISVDGINANFTIPKMSSGYKPEDIAQLMEEGLNYDTNNTSISSTGQMLRGVTVSFDALNNTFKIISPTTGDTSVIDVLKISEQSTGIEVPSLLGFGSNTRAVGEIETWVNLTQHTVNGNQTFVELGSDGYYEELTDSSSVDTTLNADTWKPIFLDPGELTFLSNGKSLSPMEGMPFTAKLLSGGDLNIPLSEMNLNLAGSGQYSGSFSILSQSQDGKPEGDLMGLDINNDGLVTASYSNGIQLSLGKIALANFSSPSGLRQMGDSSFLASASSGQARIGEAGSSGFGSIRAGAIERSNVDLTAELVNLIDAQRSFQASAKAIETTNEITETIRRMS